MRIAIATENKAVCQHFGHCPEYTIYTIEGIEIREKEVIPNPGHKPNFLPGYLHELGVDVIIAGGMGQRAHGLFAERGMQVVVGAPAETPEKLVADYLAGTLQVGENVCDH